MSVRVLHIINEWNPSKGGAERLLESLKNHWDKNNAHHDYLSIISSQNPSVSTLDSLRLKSVRTVFRLIRFLKNNNYDVVHAHLFPTIYYLSLFKSLGLWCGNLVITEHNSTNNRRKRKYRFLEKLVYREFNTIICISEGVKEALIRWIPESESKIKVVYNGTVIHANNEFQNSNKKLKLLSVGRLVEQKNYFHTLDIMRPILHDCDITYTIAGDGILRQSLKNYVEESSLENKVNFLGCVEDIQIEYLDADIFVMLSKWEGFGIACVEALSNGLRIIASDVEGMREILHPLIGKGVLLVNLNDSNKSIRNQIQAFILQPDTKVNFNLRKQRAKDFDINITAKGYTKVYQSLNRL